MLRIVRDAVTMLVLVASLTATGFSLHKAWRQPFPLAVDFSAMDLEEYLIEHDLRTESRATKVHLLRQFEGDLRTHAAWAIAQPSQLQGEEKSRFEENAWQLAEIWYLEKVNAYHEWPEHRRERNLDREIDRIAGSFRIQGGDRPRDKPPEGNGGFNLQSLAGLGAGLGVMLALQRRVDEWTSRAEPAMQPKMREFQQALQARLLAARFGKRNNDRN